MTRRILITTCSFFLYAATHLVCLHSPALAAPDEDLQTLEMFYEGKDLVVSATRSPKPVSQTAENITVITAAEIEMMGAHTLPDVLNNVPGIRIDDRGSVATFSGSTIQGANQFHVLVLLDGVTLNFLGDNTTDIAAIPVQNIERIEIVKGPGSSSWGSALGGVINIITKSPIDDRSFGGALSASIGEKLTRDIRGEASGTAESFGYYLQAGHLASDGLSPQTGLDYNNIYTKLRWDLPERGNILFTLAYTWQTVGEGNGFDPFLGYLSLYDRKRYFLSTLSLNHPLTDHVDFDLSLRTTSKRFDSLAKILSTGEPLLPDFITHESTVGGSAKVTWRERINTLVAGADYDHVDFEIDDIVPKFRSDKWGIFLNDTLTLGDFAVTPGIRYDRVSHVGDFISPSLGATWSLNDKTVLRAYVARGYSLPDVLSTILSDANQEKVFTVQTGVETTQVPHLWLKATLFRNQLSDVGSSKQKQLKQGAEAEARTVPVFNTSLSAGYTFIDATNQETGETLENIPSQIVKLGLHYNDKRSFRGTILGRYVWLNSAPDRHARYKAIIWDLNLAKKVLDYRDMALELFFNAHNIFNGAQYNRSEGFENARRWVEGGIRLNF